MKKTCKAILLCLAAVCAFFVASCAHTPGRPRAGAAEKVVVGVKSNEPAKASGTTKAEKPKRENRRRARLNAGKSETATSETAQAEQRAPAPQFQPPTAADVRAEKPAQDLMAEYPEEAGSASDPMYGWNVAWFQFNDKLYFWGVKPAAKGWRYLIYPRPARVGIHSLIENLAFPRRFFNCLFQGRVKGAGVEFSRFFVNTTAGVAGLWDPAKKWLKLEPQNRDFDQTLGKAGIGTGCYVTLPFVGPSSVRGTFGWILDTALNPAAYASGGSALAQINDTSLDLNPYETLLTMALDPYTAIRNAYTQNRKHKLEE